MMIMIVYFGVRVLIFTEHCFLFGSMLLMNFVFRFSVLQACLVLLFVSSVCIMLVPVVLRAKRSVERGETWSYKVYALASDTGWDGSSGAYSEWLLLEWQIHGSVWSGSYQFLLFPLRVTLC